MGKLKFGKGKKSGASGYVLIFFFFCGICSRFSVDIFFILSPGAQKSNNVFCLLWGKKVQTSLPCQSSFFHTNELATLFPLVKFRWFFFSIFFLHFFIEHFLSFSLNVKAAFSWILEWKNPKSKNTNRIGRHLRQVTSENGPKMSTNTRKNAQNIKKELFKIERKESMKSDSNSKKNRMVKKLRDEKT